MKRIGFIIIISFIIGSTLSTIYTFEIGTNVRFDDDDEDEDEDEEEEEDEKEDKGQLLVISQSIEKKEWINKINYVSKRPNQ